MNFICYAESEKTDSTKKTPLLATSRTSIESKLELKNIDLKIKQDIFVCIPRDVLYRGSYRSS